MKDFPIHMWSSAEGNILTSNIGHYYEDEDASLLEAFVRAGRDAIELAGGNRSQRIDKQISHCIPWHPAFGFAFLPLTLFRWVKLG